MSKEIILNPEYGSDKKINFLKSNKQPSTLYILCLTEMCERFAHYAMRGMLVLYMTKVLLFSNDNAYGVFAGFSALLYLTPFIGGYLADKFIGIKWSVLAGGGLLTLGYGLLSVPGNLFFYPALGLIVIGSGLFIPNMSGMIGELYGEKDALRDAGYSVFYGAINLGALIPPVIITTVIIRFGWSAVFMLAAIVVLLGTVIFYASLIRLPHLGNSPRLSIRQKKEYGLCMILGIVLIIPFFSMLIRFPNFVNGCVCAVGSCFLLYSYKNSFSFNKAQRNRLQVCFLLTLFTIIFEVLLQQIAMSMTIFVEYNVDRDFNVWNMPTLMFQALNPLFIIVCAPFFSKLWVWLDMRDINPSIPTKFACGTFLMGLGFVIFPIAISQSTTGQISLIWIVVSYFMQSCGELLVSPVGLSMISGMSPKSMVGTMMGVWFFATAVASSLAGIVSQWTIVSANITSPLVTAPAYAHVFGMLGMVSMIAALTVFCFLPKFRRILTEKNHENETIDLAVCSRVISS